MRRLVEEVSDDKTLPKAERKRLQIEHAASLSQGAKLIKLADKICNVREVTLDPPHDWSTVRRREYLDWAGRSWPACAARTRNWSARSTGRRRWRAA